MDYLVDRRDIDFILQDQIHYERLFQLPSFKDFSTDLFTMALDQALKFAQQEIAPLNAAGDREGCQLSGNSVTTPTGYREVYKKFAENGFIGLDVPSTFGGQGLPLTVALPMMEFFSGASISFEMYATLSRGAARLIELFGSERLKDLFVRKMYSGQWGGTMCLTEPQAGSAVGDIKTKAIPHPDGTYKIKGGKIFISSGDHDITENIIHLVLARIQGETEGTPRTLSLFVVPKIFVRPDGALDRPNDVRTMSVEHKMGIRGQATCALAFGDHDDCIGYLVGEPKAGMLQMHHLMNEARLLVGLFGLAVAGTSFEHALKYAKERVQGGGKTIINYPDVRRMLMLQKTYVEGIRSLIYHTGFYIDMAVHNPDPAARDSYQGLADLLTPVCKAFGSEIGFRMTDLAMQTYGGYGYISEYPIEQAMRDVRIASIYEGTNGIQALDLLMRKLPMKQGQVFRCFQSMIQGFIKKNRTHPVLKGEIAELNGSLDALLRVTKDFSEITGRGDIHYLQLSATPFLHLFATVTAAYYLLDQAVIASEKRLTYHENPKKGLLGDLQAFLKKKPRHRPEPGAILGPVDEAAFLNGKISTARFFVRQILPLVGASAKSIRSGDRSALQISF
jgi:alkylation response protein AidB-like acyl-CoA dehydrogenase